MGKKKKNTTEQIVTFMSELARFKYDSENERENSIIQQAATMQTAFSFVTAAVLMVAPIVIEYGGNLSLNFFLVSFSSIVLVLLGSLFSATKALDRRKNTTLKDAMEMNEYIVLHEEEFVTEIQRQKYLADTIAKVQKSVANNNDKRVTWLRISQYAFYIALLLCIFWFVVAMCKII